MANEPVVSRPAMKDYGLPEDGQPGPLAWVDVERKLAGARNYWVGTTRPDGRPHVMPVWGVWHAGAFYFATGAGTQKARNLASQPAVVVHLESGDDCVIVEGVARAVEPADWAPLDASYVEKYQLKLSEASAGAPLFEVRPAKAFAWLESDFPNTATRWTWPRDVAAGGAAP